MRAQFAPVIAAGVASATACACGRIGFAPLDDGGLTTGDTRLVDGRVIDAPPNAITVTFGERTNADFNGVTRDTYISNEAGEPTLNYGATDELRSELDVDERILLRFDLTAIPPTATVFEVLLAVEVTEANAAADWLVHPLLEAWAEGTSDGAPGAANFTQRIVAAAWATTGAGPPMSAGAPFATLKPATLGALIATLPNATVQGWITSPATNQGMIFLNTNTNSARMASREASPSNNRPMLTVTYVP
ncbi:MAG TPA: DNRLRE domain-containing protein [Kofleriaceae bacterium]